MTADVVILGLGAMGSAAASSLSRRGLKVVGFDQFPLVHHRGSSHGHTRIIRTAYYEHPAYVPLVRDSFAGWFELEQRTGRHLLTPCPCLNLGMVDSEVITGVLAAASTHQLSVESLNHTEIEARYPTFRVPSDLLGVLEHSAGFLYVEECVRAFQDDARVSGTEFYPETPVLSWSSDGKRVEVTTANGTITAANLVVTAGAWASRILGDVGVSLRVMRQVLQWFDPGPALAKFARDRFPIFLMETPAGAFYGLPAIDRRGVKVARHYGAPELSYPEDVVWTTSTADAEPVAAFLADHLPSAGQLSAAEVCLYTLTPDRHFVLDRHPVFPNVAIACGFSGHGFKFAPVVGDILADLTTQGSTRHPISLFRVDRFR